MSPGARYETRRRPRWWLIALIVVLHVLAIMGLIRAFAPDFSGAVIERAASVITVNVTAPPPPPEPSPSPDPSPTSDAGAAAEEAPEAVPRKVTAPEPRIVQPSPIPAPRASSTGEANRAGAGEQGEGTGAGGAGEGLGSGSGGSGTGGGGVPVTSPVKIAGEINNAADYPTPEGGRDLRIGHSVTIVMTVTAEGRAQDCRILEPSPDPEADRITCELAERRFRFQPARDAAGDAVEASYGWRQSWFRR